MQSLKDKLMQAGLVTEEAAKKAEQEKSAPRAPPARGPQSREVPRAATPRFAPLGAPIPKLPPMPGSKDANRDTAKKQLETDRKLRELVLAAQVPIEAGATTFYFVTRKNKLRRLELSPAQASALEKGELAVVERPDPDKIDHALVPAAVATALAALSQRAVRFLNQEGAQVGFLSEAEINARAAAEQQPDPETPAPEGSEGEQPSGPLLTIRRDPLP